MRVAEDGESEGGDDGEDELGFHFWKVWSFSLET